MAKKNKEHSDSYAKKREDNLLKQAKSILHTNSNERDNLLIHILQETGCAVSELANIKVEHIQTNSILIGKQKRKVEISHKLKDKINTYLNNYSASEFLFSSRQSSKLNTRRIQQIVKKHTGQKPIEIRHTRIVELAQEKNIDKLKQVSGLKILKTKTTLNVYEIQNLQSAIQNKKDDLAFNLLLETGCQISELVELKAKDIKENSVVVGSTKRRVEISSKLASEIKQFVNDAQTKDYIFTTRQSGKISDKRIFQILKKYGDSVNVKLNPRILRNTALANMLQTGVDKSKVELALGIKRLDFGSYGLLTKNE